MAQNVLRAEAVREPPEAYVDDSRMSAGIPPQMEDGPGEFEWML